MSASEAADMRGCLLYFFIILLWGKVLKFVYLGCDRVAVTYTDRILPAKLVIR